MSKYSKRNNCSLDPPVAKSCLSSTISYSTSSPLSRGTMKSIMQNNCWPRSYVSVNESSQQSSWVNAHSSVNIVHKQAIEQEWRTSRYMIFPQRHWKERKSHWAFTKERCCSLSTLPPSEGQRLRRWFFKNIDCIMFYILYLCSLTETIIFHVLSVPPNECTNGNVWQPEFHCVRFPLQPVWSSVTW